MTTQLIDVLDKGPRPTIEEVEAAKRELHDKFEKEDLLRLKELADMLRTPMNRRQRRAIQSRMRRAA